MPSFLDDLTSEFAKAKNRPRPYRNAAVSFRPCSIDDRKLRRRLLEEGGLNVFKFPAAMIPGCDLLTDSGTTTMTIRQWSQLLLGDESYGSNEGYYDFKQQVAETFGPQWENREARREGAVLRHPVERPFRHHAGEHRGQRFRGPQPLFGRTSGQGRGGAVQG
jgi:tryptophanase